MRTTIIFGIIVLVFSTYSCGGNQEDATSFSASMMTSHVRAIENLEENTNTALSQSKSWLEDPSRARFRPIQALAEQVDANITELQYAVLKVQLLVEQASGHTTELQESYLSLRTQLGELEQKLKNDHQQFFQQYQQDFSYTDEELADKIDLFSTQVVLLDEAWTSLQLEWSVSQYQLMLTKTNLDLATVKNWIINDLNAVFGGRAF